AAGVEVFGLARLHALADDVERIAERGPHVVVVDAGRHHVDQHLVGTEGRRGNHFALPRVARFTEAVLAHDERVHPLRDLTERGSLTKIEDVGHPFISFTSRGRRGSSRPGWYGW